MGDGVRRPSDWVGQHVSLDVNLTNVLMNINECGKLVKRFGWYKFKSLIKYLQFLFS